jgi:Autophagy receptor ATG43
LLLPNNQPISDLGRCRSLNIFNRKLISTRSCLTTTAAAATMSDSLPLEIGEIIQTASINRAPSPAHDINPSTAASEKQPVFVSPHVTPSDSSLDKYAYEGVDEEEEEEDIPYSVIRPIPRRASFPPLPDLRFEQSYLASIAAADTKWKVAYITIRDQV